MRGLKCEFSFSSLDRPEAIRRSYKENGFCIIRGIFSTEETKEIRRYLDDFFKDPEFENRRIVLSHEVAKRPELYKLYLQVKAAQALKAIIGEGFTYDTLQLIHRNHVGMRWHKNDKWPDYDKHWHFDAGSQVHQKYVYDDSYMMVKCGIYLQDADNDWGGGIAVKLNSHRQFTSKTRWGRAFYSFLNRLDNKLRPKYHVGPLKMLIPPIKAGDLLIFDHRLSHRSVAPSKTNLLKMGRPPEGSFWDGIPKEHTKYVLYWNACDKEMLDDYFKYVKMRAKEDVREHCQNIQLNKEPVWASQLRLHYPDDYDKNFIEIAKKCGITFSSLEKPEAHTYSELFSK